MYYHIKGRHHPGKDFAHMLEIVLDRNFWKVFTYSKFLEPFGLLQCHIILKKLPDFFLFLWCSTETEGFQSLEPSFPKQKRLKHKQSRIWIKHINHIFIEIHKYLLHSDCLKQFLHSRLGGTTCCHVLNDSRIESK